MRDGIICHVNLFDLHQTIREVKNDTVKDIGLVQTKDLGTAIGKYCLTNNIDYVHLYGDNLFAQRVIEDIDKATENLYSENKIEIEVN